MVRAPAPAARASDSSSASPGRIVAQPVGEAHSARIAGQGQRERQGGRAGDLIGDHAGQPRLPGLGIVEHAERHGMENELAQQRRDVERDAGGGQCSGKRGREIERAHGNIALRPDLMLDTGRRPDRAGGRHDPQHVPGPHAHDAARRHR